MNNRIFQKLHDDRGVALLIVLLVTTLLIALIFEFAYATRVSMRSAVNFRDSQRAYFLARSGISYAARSLNNAELRKFLPPQGEWTAVPGASAGDTVLNIMWENEAGKISIRDVQKDNTAYKRLLHLFELEEINLDVLDAKITDKRKFYLPGELHQVLSDDEYRKVSKYLTTEQIPDAEAINVNDASLPVLRSVCRSVGKGDDLASLIDSRRKEKPFEDAADFDSVPGMSDIRLQFTVKRTIFRIHAHARINDFTKQIEAVIDSSGNYPANILYWRAL